jgi:hypothetical protein
MSTLRSIIEKTVNKNELLDRNQSLSIKGGDPTFNNFPSQAKGCPPITLMGSNNSYGG